MSSRRRKAPFWLARHDLVRNGRRPGLLRRARTSPTICGSNSGVCITGNPWGEPLTPRRGTFVNNDVFIDRAAAGTIGDRVGLATHVRLGTSGHLIGDVNKRAADWKNPPLRHR